MKRMVLDVETSRNEEIVDITQRVRAAVAQITSGDGVAYLFCPHTTAGITINESADPDVKRDVLFALEKLISFEDQFHHSEGNSKGHVCSTLVGCSLWLPVVGGELDIGRWQSVWFCEFDGPRRRRVRIQLIQD